MDEQQALYGPGCCHLHRASCRHRREDERNGRQNSEATSSSHPSLTAWSSSSVKREAIAADFFNEDDALEAATGSSDGSSAGFSISATTPTRAERILQMLLSLLMRSELCRDAAVDERVRRFQVAEQSPASNRDQRRASALR